MIFIMTENVGYILSTLGGVFLGTLAMGRYAPRATDANLHHTWRLFFLGFLKPCNCKIYPLRNKGHCRSSLIKLVRRSSGATWDSIIVHVCDSVPFGWYVARRDRSHTAIEELTPLLPSAFLLILHESDWYCANFDSYSFDHHFRTNPWRENLAAKPVCRRKRYLRSLRRRQRCLKIRSVTLNPSAMSVVWILVKL